MLRFDHEILPYQCWWPPSGFYFSALRSFVSRSLFHLSLSLKYISGVKIVVYSLLTLQPGMTRCLEDKLRASIPSYITSLAEAYFDSVYDKSTNNNKAEKVFSPNRPDSLQKIGSVLLSSLKLFVPCIVDQRFHRLLRS